MTFTSPLLPVLMKPGGLCANLARMKAYRSALLRFDDADQAVFEQDGLLVIGPDQNGRQVVRAAGAHAALADRYPGKKWALISQDWHSRLKRISRSSR